MPKKPLILPLIAWFLLLLPAVLALPSITDFSINSGAAYTSSTSVTLSLTATDANQMCFDDANHDADPATCPLYDAYADSNTFTLSAGDGDKNVFAYVTDGNSNYDNALASIILDTNAPLITILFPAADNDTVTRPQVVFDVNDLLSGVDVSSVTVELDASGQDVNGEACDQNGGNYHCSVWLTSATNNLDDSVVTVDADDIAGNAATQASRTFDYNDNTVPTKLSAPTCTGKGDRISLSWNEGAENDLNGYKVYRFTANDTNDPGDGNLVAQGTAGELCSSPCTADDTNEDLNANTGYYYRVAVSDNAGNSSELSDASSACQLAVPGSPNLQSETHNHDTWDQNDDLNITWDGVLYATGYSCTFGTSDANAPDEVSDPVCDANQFAANDLADGTHYFKVRACNANGCSGTTDFTVKVDDTSPTAPSDAKATAESDGDILVEWDASTDDLSGIDKYLLFRSESSSVDTGGSIYTELSGTSYEDSNTSPENTYFYRVVSRDNASNRSDASNEISATTPAEGGDDGGDDGGGSGGSGDTGSGSSGQAGISLEMDVPAAVNHQVFTITVTSKGGSMRDGLLRVKRPGAANFSTLITGKNGTSFTHEYDFSQSSDGTATFRAEAKDNRNRGASTESQVIVDTNNPTVAWVSPLPDETILPGDTLTVQARDALSGVVNVFFFDGEEELGKGVKEENDRFTFEWQPAAGSDGAQTLKAVAHDKAGNTSEAEIDVISTGSGEAEGFSPDFIQEVYDQLEGTDTVVTAFSELGLPLPQDLNNLLTSALMELGAAQEAFERGDRADAEQRAQEARRKLEALTKDITLTTFASNDQLFDFNSYVSFLNSTRLDLNFQQEALTMFERQNPARSLEILQIEGSGEAQFRLRVVLRFTHNSDTNSLQLIEVVPKSVAVSASQLQSLQAFTIIAEDPVISFDFENLSAGQEVEVVYGLTEPLTREQADRLATGALVSDYPPPLMVSAGTPLEAQPLSELAGTAPFSFSSDILIVALLLILMAGVGAGYLFSMEKRGEYNPFAKSKARARKKATSRRTRKKAPARKLRRSFGRRIRKRKK